MSKSSKIVNFEPRSKDKLAPELLIKMHDLMVKTRALEERMIKMYKQNDGYFWIGGPGEEAFNIPLGLLIKKGEGPKFDYFHGHYRSSGVLMAMGADPLDSIRQMKNSALDPYSGGRNFCNHQSIPHLNVVPISSPIEVQYFMAPGTAMANKRESKDAISVVIGGDAGSAEGDFATCLIWCSRPVNELPLLMIVTNNRWGISTPGRTQHGEKLIADRGKAFGIKTMVVNGLDPEEAYLQLLEAMDYVRTHRKPLLMEASVTRLYGHSSASGANLITEEEDPVKSFEQKLINAGVLTESKAKEIWDSYNNQMLALAQQARAEPQPSGETIFDYVYFGQQGKPSSAGNSEWRYF
jgi:2-oxoisovalerate dehydrogenase E1 component alpha subunit